MCSQFMQQSMRSTINFVEIMLHVRDAKRKLQKREINTLVENANTHSSTQQQSLIFVYNELFFIK